MTATEGKTRPSGRLGTMEPETLRDWAQQARLRAEGLLARSATVLAHSGDLQAMFSSRGVRVGPDDTTVRLVDAEARIAQLERALASNRRIGMALGVLMARLG